MTEITKMITDGLVEKNEYKLMEAKNRIYNLECNGQPVGGLGGLRGKMNTMLKKLWK